MNISKLIKTAALGLVATTLVACGNGASQSKDTATTAAPKVEDKKITVVASPAPHGEILEAAKSILKRWI